MALICFAHLIFILFISFFPLSLISDAQGIEYAMNVCSDLANSCTYSRDMASLVYEFVNVSENIKRESEKHSNELIQEIQCRHYLQPNTKCTVNVRKP